MAYLVIVAASRGKRSAIFATMGVALGLLIIGILAALGLATIAAKTPLIFQTLRWLGTFYLVYLAWDTWKMKIAPAGFKSVRPQQDYQFFRRGLIVNLLNPKAALFFISILPTFVQSSTSKTALLFTLTVIYVLIATGVHLLLIFFASHIHSWFEKPSHERLMRGIFSILLLIIACWFAIVSEFSSP